MKIDAQLAYDAVGGLFEQKDYSYNDPKTFAQNQLAGRTHYVDDGTLKYFGSRILKASTIFNGLAFFIVESLKAGPYDNKRIFRPVVFTVTGTIIDRPKIDESYTSKAKAEKAGWDFINSPECLEKIKADIAHNVKAKEKAFAASQALNTIVQALPADA